MSVNSMVPGGRTLKRIFAVLLDPETHTPFANEQLQEGISRPRATRRRVRIRGVGQKIHEPVHRNVLYLSPKCKLP